MSVSLPYVETFSYPDGSPWSGNSGWVIPSPFVTQSDPADVFGHRGRVSFDNHGGYSSRFGARLLTEQTGSFNVKFRTDFSEFVGTITSNDPIVYPELWLEMQLEETGENVNYYQVFYLPEPRFDLPAGLSVVMRQYYNVDPGGNSAQQRVVGTVPLTQIDPSQPFWVQVDEGPGGRGIKVWQGAEPQGWQILDPQAAPAAAAERFVDLYAFTRFAGSPHLYFDGFAVNGQAVSSFSSPDGSPWPGSSGRWVVPGPEGMMPASQVDVFGQRGRLLLTPDWVQGVPTASARLSIDDAPTFDFRCTVDMSEIVPLMSDRGASCYFYIQLEDNTADGVIQYELSYDYDWDEDDGTDHATPRLRARVNPWGHADFFPNGYWLLGDGHNLDVNTALPVQVRIQESGTDRYFKVWQGGEPVEWTISTTGPVHAAGTPRIIDLSVFARENGTKSIYLDNMAVNATTGIFSDFGSGTVMSLPYYEPFHFPDGNPWSDGWVIPGPAGMQGGAADTFGDRGRIRFGADWFNGTPQFSARLAIEDAAMFDLRFTLDIQEMVSALNGQDTGFWFRVQLEDPGNGTVFYEIYFDPSGGNITPEAAIYKYQNGGTFADTTATGGYVKLNGVRANMDFYVRIQDSGTERRIRVWQGGDEPSTWTIEDGNAPVHSGPRYIDLSTFAQTGGANIYIDDLGVNYYDDPTTYLLLGSTEHFNYRYDSSLGVKGNTDTSTAMSYAEHDLLNHFGWFGSTATWGSKGPQRIDILFDGPELINKIAGSLAYYISEKFVVHFNWDEPTPNVELDTAHEYRAVWVHEVSHHFQNLQGAGHFFDSRSMTEAHAAFLERLFRRDIGDWAALKMGGYAQHVQTWLNSNRDDYVNYTVAFDSDDTVFNLGVGCTLLFFNWLHFAHGYSGAQITQAGGNTPRAIYRNLTGDAHDPFAVFYTELEREFDPKWAVDMGTYPDIANPYPLTPAKQATTPPPDASGTVATTMSNAVLMRQLRQNLRRF